MPIAVACSAWCIFGVQGSLGVGNAGQTSSLDVLYCRHQSAGDEFDRGRAEQCGSKEPGGISWGCSTCWVQHLL